MAFTVNLKLSGKVVEGKAAAELRKTIRRTKIAVLMQLASEVANKTPVGVSGQLRAGVDWKEEGWNKGRVYEKGPGQRYVEVVEKGRGKDKKFPPPDEIKLWLRRTDKGRAYVARIKEKYNLTTDKALNSATFLKSRAIARFGTKPIKMWQKTFRKRKSWIKKQFLDAVKRFTKN